MRTIPKKAGNGTLLHDASRNIVAQGSQRKYRKNIPRPFVQPIDISLTDSLMGHTVVLVVNVSSVSSCMVK